MADRVVVAKTRAMVAGEVATTIGAGEWQVGQLRRLDLDTLQRLARRVVPDFSPYLDAR